MHSFKDSRGHLWVACCECQRGANGDKSCQVRGKKFNGSGCFCGNLLDVKQQDATNDNKTTL